MNKTGRIKYLSSVGLLTVAVFAFSSVAPNHVIPEMFAADHAVAKNGGNGNGGNGNGGNGNGNGGNGNGGNGNGGNGKGGGNGNDKSASGNSSQSASSRGNGGRNSGRGGRKSGETGNFFETIFGRQKEKPNKAGKSKNRSMMAAAPAGVPKTKKNGEVHRVHAIKALMAQHGYRPNDLKGLNGVLRAHANGNFNSSMQSIHGRTRSWMESNARADFLSDVAMEAEAEAQTAADMAAALGALAALEKAEADYQAALANDPANADLTEVERLQAELDDALNALPGEMTRADIEGAASGFNSTEEAAANAAKEAEALAQDAADAEIAADEAKAVAEGQFDAITPNVQYDEKLADFVEEALFNKDDRWQGLYDDAKMDAELEYDLAAAEEAAAEEVLTE